MGTTCEILFDEPSPCNGDFLALTGTMFKGLMVSCELKTD
jgi:hypothetical protein